MKYLYLAFLLTAANAALACECAPLSFEKEAQSANYIFRGKVISVNGYTYDIEVLET